MDFITKWGLQNGDRSIFRKNKSVPIYFPLLLLHLTRFITYDTLISEVKNEYEIPKIKCCIRTGSISRYSKTGKKREGIAVFKSPRPYPGGIGILRRLLLAKPDWRKRKIIHS